MRKYGLLFVMALVPVLFCEMQLCAQTSQDSAYTIEERNFTKTSFGYKYLMFLPKEYSKKGKAFPLLIYLHGAGTYGTDLEKLKPQVPVKYMVQYGHLPFVVAAPLSRDRDFWDPGNVNTFIKDVLLRNNLDRSRVYLTGMSRGGRGAFECAVHYPKRFAAIAPVAGGGFEYEAEKLKTVPVWAFHGAKDRVIPIQYTYNLMKKLNEITTTDVRYTVYKEEGHGIWQKAYSTTEMYEWLLQHKNPDPIN